MVTSLVKNNELGEMKYPIGIHIESNLYKISLMCKLIIETIKTNNLNDEIYLACRGSSGAIISGIIASKLNNPVTILHVKKEEELLNTHSTNRFNLLLNKTFIIVDDLMATGHTLNSIYENLLINDFPFDKQIDILCITGEVKPSYLKFKPKFIICGF
jgi:hypoxanthine phosphoribosyltransferase